MAARVHARRHPPHYTAAQNRAFRQYLRTHPLPKNAAKTPAASKAPVVHHTKAARKRKAPFVTATTLSPGIVTVGDWIVAGNDTQATCVSVALANSLLARTGIRLADDDVIGFHFAIADEDGASIPAALELAQREGIGGHRLAGWSEAYTVCGADILGMTDGFNEHAVTVTPAGLISWGGFLTPELAADWWLDGEFYALTWREV